MKKIITILLVGMITFSASAQSNALTAGIGGINPKLRIQYEHGFAYMHSTGVNLGLYLEGQNGQRLEGFYRIYFGGDNEKGMFMQATAGAGMFSYLFNSDDQYYDGSGIALYKDDNERFTTFGGSVGFGGKMTSNGGFVFESTLGFQIWTPPPSNFNDEFVQNNQEYIDDLGNAANIVLFYVGPGFPLMFQVKFGYSF